MKKYYNGYMLTIRYGIFFMLAVSVVTLQQPDYTGTIKLLVYLLLYIINVQIRLYYLKGNSKIAASLLLDTVLISLLYYNFGGFVFVYYYIAIIDAALMLPPKYSYIVTGILIAAVCYESNASSYTFLQKYPVINIIFNLLLVLGFAGLGRYTYDEKQRKGEAQRLYDRISASEQELKQAYERLEQYSNTIEELTILKERNRISREIHDTVGHTLSSLMIQLQALPFIVKSDPTKLEETVKDMLTYTKNGIEDVRRAVHELNPQGFEDYNGIFMLEELVNKFRKSTGITVDFNFQKKDYELTQDQAITFYRILQEAMNNSIRHGDGSVILINLNFTEREINLYIKDNGKGIANVERGFGLKGIEERVMKIGGQASFYSSLGNGFEISIVVPKEQSIESRVKKEDKYGDN